MKPAIPVLLASIAAFGVWCGCMISAISVLHPLLSILGQPDAPAWGIGLLIITTVSSGIMTLVSYSTFVELRDKQ